MSAEQPTIGEQIAELSREGTLRLCSAPRTRKGERTTEAQAAYADKCLAAALRTLIAVRDGTLPPRS